MSEIALILDKFQAPGMLVLVLVLLKLWNEYSVLRSENKEMQNKMFDALVAETSAKMEATHAFQNMTNSLDSLRTAMEARR